MKKILVILSGIQLPQHVVSFAMQLAKAEDALLVGIFLSRVDYQTRYVYPFPNDMNLAEEEISSEANIEAENLQIIQTHTQYFKDECAKEGVQCKVMPFTENALDDVIDHSAFADLIIADAKTDDEEYSLKDLLSDAHCPLLLVPSYANLPKKIILTYDGSYSSIYAIKMFSYLFPHWCKQPAYLVSVTPAFNDDAELEYSQYVKDWLAKHFSQLSIQIIPGKVRRELSAFVQEHAPDAIVVMGAFGRNAVSRLFNQSLSAVLMQHTRALLFITHE